MNEAPMPFSPAPGARGAKLCGIWSIIATVTCVGIPVGIVLAIIALVQQAKANRLAKENPDLYERPAATGLVTGIIGLAMPVLMLPFIGVVSAISIPAFVGYRQQIIQAEGDPRIETLALATQLEVHKSDSGVYGPVGDYEWKADGTSQSGPSLIPDFRPRHFDYYLSITDGGHYRLVIKKTQSDEKIAESDESGSFKSLPSH